MKRRGAIGALLAYAAAAPLGVRAQPAARQFRIGVLLVGNEARLKPYTQALLDGLRERGYVLGQNLTGEFRYANVPGEMEAFADELVARKPDVLVASEITAVILKARTAALPIVLLSSADPVLAGLVQSLARPGTNVTGMAGLMHPLAQKQIELLTEISPTMSRVALLASRFDPPRDSPYYGRPEQWEVAVRSAAAAMKLNLEVHRAGNSEDLRAAFAAMGAQRTQGLVVTTETRLLRIPELWDEIQRLRTPTVSGFSAFAENGGLLSYGVNAIENNRYAAKFVDLILKGGKPADIPVEQVTRFELVINLKAAKALGLTIPQSLLVRADRVIE